MKTLIYNGNVICDGNRRLENGFVLFDQQGIIAVDTEGIAEFFNDVDIIKIDARGNWVTPGLTDIHNHGALGYDFVAVDNRELNIIADSLIDEGVTAFLASTTVDDKASMLETAKRLGTYHYESGATCLGMHMEGPFLSEKYKAVMRAELLRPADEKEFLKWQEISGGFVKTITVAPEVDGARDFIKRNSDKVVIMIGHSDASVAEVSKAVAYGAAGFTHLYNAMSQHLHRQPGVVTAAFLEDSTYCELIGDGMHVAPEVVRMTIKQLSSKRIILITDAMPGKSMPDGRFMFCKNWVYKEKGITHMENDTRIAGSIMPLNEMCHNVLSWADCSINDVVQMACVNPNKLLKQNRKGSLEIGKDSDICIFDRTMQPLAVFVGGVKLKDELN